jgi:hypothetical protein
MHIFLLVALKAGPVGDVGFHKLYVLPVRRMTAVAGRYRMRLLLPELPLDHLFMHLLDLRVTFHAGLCDIVQRNSGIPAGMRKYLVVPVAIVAGRRNNKPFLK